ncbi:helix-turn-helix transcriptional regulator [Dysgonomonas sp. HDW5A]|uniref:helix-turn-helix transcriptional regulator n=1 Tax=Dysgonomonas sp. HDW5A TaxID=2714926 RepID=UPI00140DD0FD|nr:helix-turn-helix transcriptional regulator [Dysgonomonas sp. HDW5A]QIK58770.1 helix-turn-helix transcriptional regulator [Dysgonomonas sp. HDW5A]
MFEKLTNTQSEVLAYNGAGLSTGEIADKMGISTETAKTHLKNIKERLGLQKINELAAYYWVTIFGESFEEKRKQILATVMLMFFMITILPQEDNQDLLKNRNRIIRTKVSTRKNHPI